MCSLRMLIPLHRGSTDAACGQAMDRRGRESAVRTTGLVKRLGPEWRMPSRPLVDRTRQPPANGVEHCETDANRGCGRKTPGASGDSGHRKGVGTSDGKRQRVECRASDFVTQTHSHPAFPGRTHNPFNRHRHFPKARSARSGRGGVLPVSPRSSNHVPQAAQLQPMLLPQLWQR